MPNPIIVPLDVPDIEAARRSLDALAPFVDHFKVGKQLFTAAGPSAVEQTMARWRDRREQAGTPSFSGIRGRLVGSGARPEGRHLGCPFD